MQWGADGKVRQLEARYPWLATAEARGRARATTTPDPQLDVAAVVKASQALSSEILLPRLIERLMAIALQNGGADRGLPRTSLFTEPFSNCARVWRTISVARSASFISRMMGASSSSRSSLSLSSFRRHTVFVTDDFGDRRGSPRQRVP